MRYSSGKLNMYLWFLLLQTIFFVTFMMLDLTKVSSDLSIIIKYTIIITCFMYTLIPVNKRDFIDRNYFLRKGVYKSTLFCLQAALFFTAISDLFILILDYYLYGVITFIIVQEFYSARLIILNMECKTVFRNSKDENKDVYPWRTFFFAMIRRILLQLFIAVIICLLLLHFNVTPELLLFISVFYFICILSNVITASYQAFRDIKTKATILYAVGMILFLLCDINVGLFNLSGFITMPRELYSVIYSLSSILMWTFYAPSQVLIVLSSKYISPRK